MGRLEGKIAVITGANSGIGLAAAQRFVAEGAYVYITGRRQDELDKAVQRIGSRVTAVQGDVANLDDLDRLYRTVKDQKGAVDIVVQRRLCRACPSEAACRSYEWLCRRSVLRTIQECGRTSWPRYAGPLQPHWSLRRRFRRRVELGFSGSLFRLI